MGEQGGLSPPKALHWSGWAAGDQSEVKENVSLFPSLFFFGFFSPLLFLSLNFIFVSCFYLKKTKQRRKLEMLLLYEVSLENKKANILHFGSDRRHPDPTTYPQAVKLP